MFISLQLPLKIPSLIVIDDVYLLLHLTSYSNKTNISAFLPKYFEAIHSSP